MQPVIATSADLDDEAVFRKPLPEISRRLGFVFNDQRTHDFDQRIHAMVE